MFLNFITINVIIHMSNEEIKKEVEICYKQIKEWEDRLSELRNICNHKKTLIGPYSWRVGSILNGEICEFCGKLIKLDLDENILRSSSDTY